MRTHRWSWAWLAGGLALAGCSGNVIGPDNQLEVTNATDDFQLQATALDNISQTLSYLWQNTGTSASVDQSGSVTAGSATLTILDQTGAQVYVASLASTGSFQTSAGLAGTWTIRVEMDGMSGALNFRVQKP
jgi:hypothetical protein